MDIKNLAKILVLSTGSKEAGLRETNQDFWTQMESLLITKMKISDLQSLIYLLWSANELGRGSMTFYSELESQLTKKILKVSDEDYSTLIGCFTQENSIAQSENFSKKFINIVLGVISEKKDRF